MPQSGQNQHSIVFVWLVFRANIFGVPFVTRKFC